MARNPKSGHITACACSECAKATPAEIQAAESMADAVNRWLALDRRSLVDIARDGMNCCDHANIRGVATAYGIDDIDLEAEVMAVIFASVADCARAYGISMSAMLGRTHSPTHEQAAAMAHAVGRIIGDDGTGDLYVIAREALKDDPTTTADDIAATVRDAREDGGASESANPMGRYAKISNRIAEKKGGKS